MPSQEEITSKANTSQTLAAIQPSPTQPINNQSLDRVRLVYIQYGHNKDLAEKLQKALQSQNIFAPGIEKVDGISKNDIRYANAEDEQIAKNFETYIENSHPSIQIEELINLSRLGYRVPSGQFEVWLE